MKSEIAFCLLPNKQNYSYVKMTLSVWFNELCSTDCLSIQNKYSTNQFYMQNMQRKPQLTEIKIPSKWIKRSFDIFAYACVATLVSAFSFIYWLSHRSLFAIINFVLLTLLSAATYVNINKNDKCLRNLISVSDLRIISFSSSFEFCTFSELSPLGITCNQKKKSKTLREKTKKIKTD